MIAFLKSEKGHIGVIPHPHTIMGTKEEGQGGTGGVWRWVEVIWMEGRVRGELAPFVFIFPSHLPFLGFPLSISLQGQKCANPEKGPKVEDMTPF